MARPQISAVGFVLICAWLSPATYAQRLERNERPAACDQYDKIQAPSEDLPTQDDRSALVSCNSEDLYFGFGRTADPVSARKCAYLEREKSDRQDRLIFAGSGLLTMIYANGNGARRNFGVALKFSCEVDGAPAENNLRFRHLMELGQQHWTGSDFNLCDDATSGFMQGWCADLQERFEKAKRERRLSEITAYWTANERTAFHELQEAARDYFEASSRNEVDLSGTGRAAFEIEAEAILNDDFVAAVGRFEKGEFPRLAASDLSKADDALNSTYDKIESDPNNTIAATTITHQGVREAERAWLRYREAWVNFASVKYPKVPAEAFRAWLTNGRLKLLESLS